MQVYKNFIFVTPIQQESRIILPPIFQKAMNTVQRGMVKACGPKSHVNVGETIVFDKWQDNAIKIEGQEMLIIKPNSVIAVEK